MLSFKRGSYTQKDIDTLHDVIEMAKSEYFDCNQVCDACPNKLVCNDLTKLVCNDLTLLSHYLETCKPARAER